MVLIVYSSDMEIATKVVKLVREVPRINALLAGVF
jgi:hypothetical protein